MNKSTLLLIFGSLCFLLASAPALAQVQEWTGPDGLTRSTFETAYRGSEAGTVVVLGKGRLVGAEGLDVRIFIGLATDAACSTLAMDDFQDLLDFGASESINGGCQAHWLTVTAAEEPLSFPVDSIYRNAVLISEPLLGLLFFDPGTPTRSAGFLIDSRSRRFDPLELIANASVGAGRDLSSAQLQIAEFANYRQEWPDGRDLQELRNEIGIALEALFGEAFSSER